MNRRHGNSSHQQHDAETEPHLAQAQPTGVFVRSARHFLGLVGLLLLLLLVDPVIETVAIP